MRPAADEPTFAVMAERATYDLVAIGSGPAGRSAALQAAALGKRAAIVERGALGGEFPNTAAVSARTIRSELLSLGNRRMKAYHSTGASDRRLTPAGLIWRTREVIDAEHDTISDRLRAAGVQVVPGAASLHGPHRLEVRSPEATLVLHAKRTVIAVGSVRAWPETFAFDAGTIVDPEHIADLREWPRTMTVVGAGPVGLEYASMLAMLGRRVTVVDRRPRLLEHVDGDLTDALQYHLQGMGVVFRLGVEVEAVQRASSGKAVARLAGGEQVVSDAVLFAGGRRGATDGLGLAAAGVAVDADGQIRVDSDLRTDQPHIFAAGDVVGRPRLAANAVQQGRDAALLAFGHAPTSRRTHVPQAIFTIPELSFVGAGEAELAAAGIPFVCGFGAYRDLVCARIAGVRSGLLKLLVDPLTRAVLGVHICGTAATELVHVGQAVVAADLGIDYLIEAGFNLPAFSDAYRIAALDAAAQIRCANSNGSRRPGTAMSPMRAHDVGATVVA
jgi:NAD(P) transhydrogenase